MGDHEQRCYDNGTCPYHKMIEKTVSGALPKWVFLSAIGTIITVATIFAAWHVSSLQAFDNEYQQQIVKFNSLAMQNKELLVEVRTELRLLQDRLKEDRRHDNMQRFNFPGTSEGGPHE